MSHLDILLLGFDSLTWYQQVNDNMNGQKDVKAGMNGNGHSTNVNANGNANGIGNGQEARNHHLHPSLQHPKPNGNTTPPDSTPHHHPSFQPYCKHSEADGDLHSHALGTSGHRSHLPKLMNRFNGARWGWSCDEC